MFVIIGLGNPGKKFKGTRHNLGFEILNQFRKEYGFSNWKQRKEFKAKISKISKVRPWKEKIVLAKPQTFMNESGKAVRLCTVNYKLSTINLFVVHDDLDIPIGKMKISKGKGSGGHKGVQSIIDKLGTKEFVRFRIGIRPEGDDGGRTSVISQPDFVLGKFTKEEQKNIKKIKKGACEALELAIKQGVEKAMTEFNC